MGLGPAENDKDGPELAVLQARGQGLLHGHLLARTQRRLHQGEMRARGSVYDNDVDLGMGKEAERVSNLEWSGSQSTLKERRSRQP